MNINKFIHAPAAPCAWLFLAVLFAPQTSAFAQQNEVPVQAEATPLVKSAEEIAEEQEAEEQREKLARFKAEYLIKQVENKRINSEIELLKNKITKKKLEQDLQKLSGGDDVIAKAKKPTNFFAPIVEAIEQPIAQAAQFVSPAPMVTQATSNNQLAYAPVDEVTVTSFIIAYGAAYADFNVDGEQFANIGERELFAGGYRFVYRNNKVQVTFSGKRINVKGLSSEL